MVYEIQDKSYRGNNHLASLGVIYEYIKHEYPYCLTFNLLSNSVAKISNLRLLLLDLPLPSFSPPYTKLKVVRSWQF